MIEDPAWRTGRCGVCRLPSALCVCARLPRVDLPFEVLIVRHHKERFSGSNTGALAHRLLPNSRLLRYAPRLERFDPAPLLRPGTVVLFPAAGAPVLEAEPRPARLVLLDATWRQARRMSTRIEGLRRLPFAALPPADPRWTLRAPPEAGRLSTAEAGAHAIACLGFEREAAEVRAALDLALGRLLRLRRKPAPDAGTAGRGRAD